MPFWDKEDRDYGAMERYFNRDWEDSDDSDDKYWMFGNEVMKRKENHAC